MEIFAALVIGVLCFIFGLSVAYLYYLYHEGWKEDEAKREFLKMRVFGLDADVSELKGWRKHYTWRVEQIEERIKKLEPTEATE
jgi:hypothetical protein